MELKQYEEEVIFKYFDNDDDHQYIHSIEVMNMANDIKQVLGIEIDDTLVFLAAISHDIEATKSFETHHEIAHDFVLKNKALLMKDYKIDENGVTAIAMACLQHRQYFTGIFYSGLSELLYVANKLVSGGFNEFIINEYSRDHSDDLDFNQDVTLSIYEKFDYIFFQSQERFPVLYQHYEKTPKREKVKLLSKYLDYLLDKNPALKKKSCILQMNSFK